MKGILSVEVDFVKFKLFELVVLFELVKEKEFEVIKLVVKLVGCDLINEVNEFYSSVIVI